MKQLLHHFLIHSSEAPSLEDLEAQRLNQQRMLQVIGARWMTLAVFLLYGGYLTVYLARDEHFSVTGTQIWVPIAGFLTVAAYNLLFQLSYRRWSRVRIANLGQLLVDSLVVVVLIHYSGGVHSWFWVVFLLIILEAAFLLERSAEVWIVVGGIWLLHGSLLALEAAEVIAPQAMPHLEQTLHHDLEFVMVSFGWMLCMSAVVTGVAIALASLIHEREVSLLRLVVRDELTGLYNRRHFFQRLRGEVARCKRYKRSFSLILIDVDDFKSVNDRYGHLAGDEVLRALGELLGSQLRRSDTEPSYDVDIACRYGGEEFAIILPETEGEGSLIAAERIREQVAVKGAWVVAERIRKAIAKSEPGGLHVTVSLGICTFPLHGETVDEIVAAADAALYQAKDWGKDRVIVAPEPPPVPEPAAQES